MDTKSAEGNAQFGNSRDQVISDQDNTDRRYRELHSYYEENVLRDREFICDYDSECNHECRRSPQASLFEGNLPYIGRHYDITVSGKQQRLVVVGLDAPGERLCDLNERREQFSNLNEPIGRNPHLQGTEQVLRLMLGIGIGNDGAGRNPEINGEKTNIYETFSLLNMCICSCSQKTSSKLTRKMMENCGRHFLLALEVLNPTLIVVQSIRSAWRVLRGTIEHAYDDLDILKEEPGIVDAHCRGWRILAFHHPSYRKQMWRYGTGEYFRSTVKPALEKARDA